MSEIELGDVVRVRLRPECRGREQPHDGSEDGAIGKVTSIAGPAGHVVFVLFRTRVTRRLFGEDRPMLGLTFRHDELEVIGDGAA